MKTRSPRGARTEERALTLVEVLITVAIMSLLAVVAAVAAFQIHAAQQRKVAQLSASTLRRSASVWRLNHPGEECPSFARLRADRIVDRESSATDPWGSPYVISCAEDDVTVLSPGPDRQAGTADDIVAPPDTAVANRH